jgi:hypothetical protein
LGERERERRKRGEVERKRKGGKRFAAADDAAVGNRSTVHRTAFECRVFTMPALQSDHPSDEATVSSIASQLQKGQRNSATPTFRLRPSPLPLPPLALPLAIDWEKKEKKKQKLFSLSLFFSALCALRGGASLCSSAWREGEHRNNKSSQERESKEKGDCLSLLSRRFVSSFSRGIVEEEGAKKNNPDDKRSQKGKHLAEKKTSRSIALLDSFNLPETEVLVCVCDPAASQKESLSSEWGWGGELQVNSLFFFVNVFFARRRVILSLSLGLLFPVSVPADRSIDLFLPYAVIHAHYRRYLV